MICTTSLAENRGRILVIDSGASLLMPYMCVDGHVDLTGTGYEDTISHGQIVVNIIAKGIKDDQCITMIKYTNSRERNNSQVSLGRIILAAIRRLKPVAINMSFAGEDKDSDEKSALLWSIQNNIHVFIAAGNSGIVDNCNVYPACYSIAVNTLHVISSRDPKANKFRFAEYIKPADKEEADLISKGTSFATAIALKRWLMK